jgi:hypothetical protein
MICSFPSLSSYDIVPYWKQFISGHPFHLSVVYHGLHVHLAYNDVSAVIGVFKSKV